MSILNNKMKRRIKNSIAFILMKTSIIFTDLGENLRHYAKILDENIDKKIFGY